MLANYLAGTVANLWGAVISIGSLRRKLLRASGSLRRSGKRADFLDGTQTDAIGFTQGPIDGSRFGYAHFGSPDKRGDVRRVGVAEANKTPATFRTVDSGFENIAAGSRIAEGGDCFNLYARAPLPLRHPQQ